MKINRNNYEAFFLDYIEGQLSKKDLAELMLFISENPDLKEELEAFENININPDNKEFPQKSTLKKASFEEIEITNKNQDEVFISYFEGDLNEGGKEKLKNYIGASAKREKDFNLYKKAFLKPNIDVEFKDKSSLKKSLELKAITSTTFTEFCIAFHEKQLSEDGIQKLNIYLEEFPERKIEFNKLAATVLISNKNLVFPFKSRLKKLRTINLRAYTVLRYATAAAAVIALFLVIRNSINVNQKPLKDIAGKENVIVEPDSQKTVSNYIAETVIDNKKTKAVDKAEKKVRENELRYIKRKSALDSNYVKPVRLKNLSPLIINSGRNYQFTQMEETPDINDNYEKIANISKIYSPVSTQQFEENKENDYLSLNEFVADRIKRFVLKENYSEEKSINYLDIAEFGIAGLDKITPGTINFEHQQNNEGEIQYLAISTKRVGFSKNFN